MDAGEDWNCVPDPESMKADIVLFASLSGKRMEVPERFFQNQILIDDSAQCYDGTSGFRKETDYSIFSFGIGKQMAVGAGGILYSRYKNFGIDQSNLEDWQKYLILSQLSKIKEINRLRIENALRLIDGLKDLPWLRLPDPQNHCFSKFVVFIDQGRKPFFEVTRTPEIFRFMRHMANHGVQVEETYIPLHVRFPNEFPEKRYDNFKLNGLWPEAITLPCRPNLTGVEIDQIIDSVRSFASVSIKDSLKHSGRQYPLGAMKPRSKNNRIFCINYQSVSLYEEQGWSKERLSAYYNPEEVGDVLIAAHGEKGNEFSEKTKAVGFNTRQELDKIVRDFQPDVIRCYECNQPFASIALEIAKTLRIPSYLSLHDSRKQISPSLSGYTVVTAYTDTLAKQAQSILGRYVEVQRNGVDSTFFDPTKAAVTIDFLKYDLVITSSGRMDPVKNIIPMINAVSNFRHQVGIDVCFVLIGIGVDELGYQKDWIYPFGKTAQKVIRYLLYCSDIFFQVQLVPEISMAGTEALMMGIPLINGENMESASLLKYPIGLVVDQPQDVDILCSYLEFAWANLKELKSESYVRRQFAIDMFDAEKMRRQEALRYINLFKESRDGGHSRFE